MMFQKRHYRQLIQKPPDYGFQVLVKETDLFVHAPKQLEPMARELVMKHRGYIESYIDRNPDFLHTFVPWNPDRFAPLIIQNMIDAGIRAGVGPMAAVAGAVAESVGKDLLCFTDDVIIENGGDIFIRKNGPVVVGVYAGKSPLSLRIGILADIGKYSYSVCTSSGTVGHSVSFGIADAVCVVSESAALADAAATAIGNHVKSLSDIPNAMNFGKQIEGVSGIVIIIKDKIAAWGQIEIVPLSSSPKRS